MSNARQIDPPHTPPTPIETELGYAFTCAHCDRQWAARFLDARTRRCVPCAREWRRDDMASRRRGLGGVPLTKNPAPHPFESAVLKKEINLNSAEARETIASNARFRAEVIGYIDRMIASNSTPKPPLRGIVPLLPRTKSHEAAEHVDIPSPAPTAEDAQAADIIANTVRERMEEIEGEVVE